MSRAKNLAINIKWSYVGTMSITLFGFLVRTVFIYSLGKTMLGLNTLYASVIGVLSIAELGVGAILNTQLYKPVAEKDEVTIIAIVQLYRKIYMAIACVIAVVGLSIIPFLDVFLKGAEEIENVKVYYLFYLFNTVISYFVSYKFSISNAEQKNYINVNFDTIFTLITYVGQILILIIFKSYFAYLLIQSVFLASKALSISVYMNNRYPILKNRSIISLSMDKRNEIKKNIFAGIINKFSDTAINQTDSMIISAFVNISSLGLVSPYTTLRDYVEKFTKPLLDNSGSVIGNYVNTESKERKKLLIKALQLYSFAIYGYASLALFFLSVPFVRIWLGEEYMISINIIFVYCLNLMFSGVGDRPYVIFKNSHGNFYNDWFVVLGSAIVNLVISIALVVPLGIVGVFLGTTFTILTSVVWRPILFYREATGEKVFFYYFRVMRNYVLVLITGVLCHFILNIVTYSNVFIELFVKFIIVTFVSGGFWWISFCRTEEFIYIKSLVKNILKK